MCDDQLRDAGQGRGATSIRGSGMPPPVGALAFPLGTQRFMNQQAGALSSARQAGNEFGVSRKDHRHTIGLDAPPHRSREMVDREWIGVGARPQLQALTFLGGIPTEDRVSLWSIDRILVYA